MKNDGVVNIKHPRQKKGLNKYLVNKSDHTQKQTVI